MILIHGVCRVHRRMSLGNENADIGMIPQFINPRLSMGISFI